MGPKVTSDYTYSRSTVYEDLELTKRVEQCSGYIAEGEFIKERILSSSRKSNGLKWKKQDRNYSSRSKKETSSFDANNMKVVSCKKISDSPRFAGEERVLVVASWGALWNGAGVCSKGVERGEES